MAKIKIILEPHETEEQAEEMLLKALTHHSAGKEHREAFHQPAARDTFNKMIKEHDKMWDKMLREISQVIDEEI